MKQCNNDRLFVNWSWVETWNGGNDYQKAKSPKGITELGPQQQAKNRVKVVKKSSWHYLKNIQKRAPVSISIWKIIASISMHFNFTRPQCPKIFIIEFCKPKLRDGYKNITQIEARI